MFFLQPLNVFYWILKRFPAFGKACCQATIIFEILSWNDDFGFGRHIASKLTIVSKFYQIVRVEKCALNTDSTIPTQSIILSDHVVGKMFI